MTKSGFLYVIALFFLPTAAIACSPPMGMEKMSASELQSWGEASPCPSEINIDKYDAIKKACIEKKIKNTGVKYEDFVNSSPRGDNTVADCNHEAYINSERK